MPQSHFETERCIIRPMRYRDAWCLRSAFNTPGFDRGMYMKGPFSFVGAIRVVHGFLRSARSGRMHPFTIADKANRCMGQIWIVHRSQWEIGYWMHPQFQRKGFMKRGFARNYALRSFSSDRAPTFHPAMERQPGSSFAQ